MSNIIARLLDDLGYGEVVTSLQEASQRPVWADYGSASKEICELGGKELARLVRCLYFGERVPADLLPAALFRELRNLQIVQVRGDRTVTTNGYGVVATNGLYLIADLPISYPTAVRSKPRAYLDEDSFALLETASRLCHGVCLDLGTGAGLFAMELARRGNRVVGIDRDPEALRVARCNSLINGLANKCDFVCADFVSCIQNNTVNFAVANLPSVPTSEPESEFLAGGGGRDGLGPFSKVLHGLFAVLSPGGTAVVMTGSLGTREGPTALDSIIQNAESTSFELTRDVIGCLSIDDIARVVRGHFEHPDDWESFLRTHAKNMGFTAYFHVIVTINRTAMSA